jgi:hypothetical protein
MSRFVFRCPGCRSIDFGDIAVGVGIEVEPIVLSHEAVLQMNCRDALISVKQRKLDVDVNVGYDFCQSKHTTTNSY